jgi:hypothetical protein
MLTLTPKQIAEVGETSNRTLPVVPLVYRYLMNNSHKFNSDFVSVLDYGCGKNPSHIPALRRRFDAVFKYDVAHFPVRPTGVFDIVAASNVLNVLPTIKSVAQTIADIAAFVKPDGCAIINYPETPRKSRMKDGTELDADGIEVLLKLAFKTVQRLPYYGTKDAPVFKASHLYFH